LRHSIRHSDRRFSQVLPIESLTDIKDLNTIKFSNFNSAVKKLHRKHPPARSSQVQVLPKLRWIEKLALEVENNDSGDVESVCRFTFYPQASLKHQNRETYIKALKPAMILALRIMRDVIAARLDLKLPNQ
jgi:hypothetical protein